MMYFNVTTGNVNTSAPGVLAAFTDVLQRPEPRVFSYAHDKQNRMYRAMGICVPSADTAQRVVRSLGIEHVIPKLQYEELDDVTTGFTMTARGKAADELFVALDALDAWFYVGVHSITVFCIRTHDTPLFSVIWDAVDDTATPAERKAERKNCEEISLQYIDFVRIQKQRRQRILKKYNFDKTTIDSVDYSITNGYALRGRMQILATEHMYRNDARTVGNE